MARELRIRIETEGDDQARKNLAGVEKSLDGVTGASEKTNKEITEQEKNWRRLGAAIGAAFSLQQLADQAGKVTAFTSRIDEMAEKMQVGTGAVQEIAFAFTQHNRTLEQAGNAFAFMNRKIAEGGEDFGQVLSDLGFSIDQVRQMKPDEVFTKLGTAITGIEDPFKRSATAAEVFGARLGPELLPVFTNLEQLRQQARDTGLVLDDSLIKRGDQLGNVWEAQKTKVDVLRTQAMLPLLELFLALPEPIQTVLSIGMEFAGVLSGIATALLVLVGPKALLASLGSALTTVGSTIGTVVAAIGAIPLAFVAAGAALFIWREDILRDLGGLKHLPKLFADIWKTVTGGISSFVSTTLGFFSNLVTGAVDSAKKTYDGIKLWMVDKFNALVGMVKEPIDKVKTYFYDLYVSLVGRSIVPDTIDGIQREFQRLDQVMVQPVTEATTRTTSLFQEMLTSITNKFTSWGNSLGGWLQGHLPGVLGRGMSSIVSGLLGAFGGLLTGGISQLVAMGAQLAWQGLKKLGGAIAGLFKSEGAKTNDTRDEWMAKLGGLEGAHRLIAQMGNDATLMSAFEKAYFASNRDVFKAGASAFEARLRELQMGQSFGGFGGMTFGSGALPGGGAATGMPAMGAEGLTIQPQPIDWAEGGRAIAVALLEGLRGEGKELVIRLDGNAVGRGLVPYLPVALEQGAIA